MDNSDEVGLDRSLRGIVMPVRVNYEGHQCRCQLVKQITAAFDADGNAIERTIRDKCGQWVHDPEQPICDDCLRCGHDTQPEWRLRETR